MANYGTFIKQHIDQDGWATFYDTYALVPYMLKTNGTPGYITYNDTLSTYYRICIQNWQRGLGGSFMWSLDADYDGHSQDTGRHVRSNPRKIVNFLLTTNAGAQLPTRQTPQDQTAKLPEEIRKSSQAHKRRQMRV